MSWFLDTTNALYILYWKCPGFWTQQMHDIPCTGNVLVFGHNKCIIYLVQEML